MPSKETQILRVKFLKSLSKIKGWDYTEAIEKDKKKEIKDFIWIYSLNNQNSGSVFQNVSYTHLDNLCNHPVFKPGIKALLTLLESSRDETEFAKRYEKVTTSNLK